MSERDFPEREPLSPDPLSSDPERLLHDRELGKLLASASAAYRSGLDEARAFQRLSERLEVPERRWRWQGLTLGAVLCSAAGVVLVLGVFDDAPGRVALGPEVSTGRRVPRADRAGLAQSVEGEARVSTPDTAQPDTAQPDTARIAEHLGAESAPAAESAPLARGSAPAAAERTGAVRSAPQPARERQATRAEAAPAQAVRAEPSATHGEAEAQVVGAPVLAERPERPEGVVEREPIASPPVPPPNPGAPAPSSLAVEGEARVDCSELLQKDARAAEHCYAQRAAESSGLSAEAALYELARLRRDVQRDAKGALTALNEYRDRFPHGSLRNEVGLSRVELLSGLGRSREALSEAEALLGSGSERAAELYLLRGDIFRRDLADFAQAAAEYSKAEKFGGGFGTEATRLRGLSLEALGDVEGALAAYRRYLSAPDPPRKGEVNRRVQALTSSQRSSSP